jgi:hypothetical protein
VSRLIASILLSVLLVPVASIVYLVVFFVSVESRWFRGINEGFAFVIAGIVTSALTAWYWVLAWRRTVNWTPQRTTRTLGAAAMSVFAGFIAGAALSTLNNSFAFFIGSVVPPLLWLVATVLVWRETDAERSARLRAQGIDGNGPGVPCPTCGYDMTGLKGTRCPECGSEFTVDEVVASLPRNAAVELQR